MNNSEDVEDDLLVKDEIQHNAIDIYDEIETDSQAEACYGLNGINKISTNFECFIKMIS